MDMLKKIVERAANLNGVVVFAEGDEPRTVQAAVRLAEENVCRTALVSPNKAAVMSVAEGLGLKLNKTNILKPAFELLDKDVLENFYDTMAKKGNSLDDARLLAMNPLYFQIFM